LGTEWVPALGYSVLAGSGPLPHAYASCTAETRDWENADSVAGDAYESAVGEEIPADDSDLSGNPRGEPCDDEVQETLAASYPRLAARFR
jgi:hypothetical protein